MCLFVWPFSLCPNAAFERLKVVPLRDRYNSLRLQSLLHVVKSVSTKHQALDCQAPCCAAKLSIANSTRSQLSHTKSIPKNSNSFKPFLFFRVWRSVQKKFPSNSSTFHMTKVPLASFRAARGRCSFLFFFPPSALEAHVVKRENERRVFSFRVFSPKKL